MGMVCALMTCASCFPDPEQSTIPVFSTRLSLLNRTHELIEADITPLYDTYDQCPHAQAHPAQLLRGSFDRTRTMRVVMSSGQELPINLNERYDIYAYDEYGYGYGGDFGGYYYNSGCEAYLIEVTGLSPIVAYLPENMDYKSFMFDADVPENIPSDVQTIELNADYSKVLPTLKTHTWRTRACAAVNPLECTGVERKSAALRPPGATYTWGQSKGQRLYQAFDDLPKEDASCTAEGQWSVSMPTNLAGGFAYDVRARDNGRCHEFYTSNADNAAPAATICFDDNSLREALRMDTDRSFNFNIADSSSGLQRRVTLEIFYNNEPQFTQPTTFVFSEGYTIPPYTTSRLGPTCRAVATTCGLASVRLNTYIGFNEEEPLIVPSNVWTPNPDGWDLHILDAYQHIVLNNRCEQLQGTSNTERQHFTYVRRRLSE